MDLSSRRLQTLIVVCLVVGGAMAVINVQMRARESERQQELAVVTDRLAEQNALQLQVMNAAALFQDGHYDDALAIFQEAAGKGNTDAQYNLGMAYSQGLGVAQNYADALTWFRKAADAGDADAAYNIGYIYANGLGVSASKEEAVKWFEIAELRGVAEASDYLRDLREDSGHGRN